MALTDTDRRRTQPRREPTVSDEGGPKFFPAEGSVIGGYSRDKRGRITEALQDMQLAVNGMAMQFGENGGGQGEEWTTAVAALARACSMFLRKTVLGDLGRRETRLLDDDVLDALGLRFHRLVTVPRELRRPIRIEFGGIQGGELHITTLNDETREPERTYTAPMGPQTLEIVIQWPLPGAIGWIGVPTEQQPWQIVPEMLFRLDQEPGMDCDDWLSQQVVRFDNRGISLKEIIQTVVNFEAAHSVSTSRLATIGGVEPNRAARNPAPHILNAVTFCGIRFAHLVVIESGMYLYDALLDNKSVACPKGDLYRMKLGVGWDADQNESETPGWARFQGTMMIAFHNAPTVIRHEIRPVGKG